MEGPRKRLVINLAGQAIPLESIDKVADAFRDAAKSIQALESDRERMILAYGQAWMALNEYGTDDEINYVRTAVKVNSKTLDSWAAVYLQGAGDDGRWDADKIQRLRVKRQAKANETGRGALLAQHRVMSAPIEELTVTDVMYLMGHRSLNQLLGIKPTDSPRARMNEDGSPADNDLLGDDEGGSNRPRARKIWGGDGGFLDAGQEISADSPRARTNQDDDFVPFEDDSADPEGGAVAADDDGDGEDEDTDGQDFGADEGGETASLSPCVAAAPAAPTPAPGSSEVKAGAAPALHPSPTPTSAPAQPPAKPAHRAVAVQATFEELYKAAEEIHRFAQEVTTGGVDRGVLAEVLRVIRGRGAAIGGAA